MTVSDSQFREIRQYEQDLINAFEVATDPEFTTTIDGLITGASISEYGQLVLTTDSGVVDDITLPR